MKTLLLFLSFISAFALDNAIRLKDRSNSTQTRPTSTARTFARDEICGYPKPFVNGTAATLWQWDERTRWPASAKCPIGSAKAGTAHYNVPVTPIGTFTVDFRDTADACSGASTTAACRALGLTTAQVAAVNIGAGAGVWNAGITVTADPQGSTTAQTVDVQTMLAAGHCWAYYSGPMATQLICGHYNSDGTLRTQRDYTFGWIERRLAKLTSSVGSTDTQINVENAAHWAGLSKPFKIYLPAAEERVSICHVDTSANPHRLYVGPTNGSSSACQTTAGRAQDGTIAGFNGAYPAKPMIQLADSQALYLTAGTTSGQTSITVADASSITPPTVLKVGAEEIRVCSKSGNVLNAGIVGTCPHAQGRTYRGTNPPSGNGSIYWGPGHPVYDANASDMWVDAPSAMFKSLEVSFVVTVYTGFAGVGIEWGLENTWTDRAQDQNISVIFKSGVGLGTTVATKANIRASSFARFHYPDGPALASWPERKVFLGTAPVAVTYDYNRAYLRYSGLFPFDPDTPPNSGLMDQQLNGTWTADAGPAPGWNLGDKGVWPHTGSLTNGYIGRFWSGLIYKSWPDPGGRPDLGLFHQVVGDCVALQGSTQTSVEKCTEELLPAYAYASGHSSVHFREGSTSRLYCAAAGPTANPASACSSTAFSALSAFGRPVSVDGRPNFDYYCPGCSDDSVVDDRVTVVGHATSGGWGLSQSDKMAHFTDVATGAHALLGDHWFLEEIIFAASYAHSSSSYYTFYDPSVTNSFTRSGLRHGSWGLMSNLDGQRNYAWATRQVSRAAVFAQDGSPEAYLYRAKWRNLVELFEGKMSLTTGSYYRPCPSPLSAQYDYSVWCLGFWFHANGDPNVAVTVPGHPSDNDGTGGGSNWMTWYLEVTLGHAEMLGLTDVGPVRKAMARRNVNILMNRDEVKVPFNIGLYTQPWHVNGSTSTLGTSIAWPTFAAYYARMSLWPLEDPGQYVRTTVWVNEGDKQGGYSNLARADVAFDYDAEFVTPAGKTIRGDQAWRWIDGTVGRRDLNGTNFQWQFTPTAYHEIRHLRALSSTTTPTILFTRPPQASACSYVVNPTSSLDSGDTSAPQTKLQGSISPTLPSGQTSIVRVTCGSSARGQISVTVP